VNPYHVISDLDFAIDKLILHGRPHAAIGCIYHQVLSKKDFTPDLAVQALRAGLSSDEPTHAIGAHEIVEVIKALQLHPSATEEDICSVEWPYVGLLDDIHGARPTKLGERLAKSPEFFCELVQLVFRPRNAPKESSEVDEGKRSIATNAYRLLNGWRIPPGVVGKDFFPEKFVSWLEKMIAVSSENGRFEVAMNMLGHCLLYSPADPSGLWIHKAIANALNKLDAQDMRDGFRTAYFNSRGVFSFSKGVQERSLAREFAGKAADLDAEGFVRLAATMRELAATYEKDAERQERRDPYDDD
jgi:hypothetical protein